MKFKIEATTDNRLYRLLQRYQRQMRDSDVEIVRRRCEADAIVFAETLDWKDPQFQRVHRHPAMREFPEKCVLFNEADRSSARLPAIAVNARNVPWQLGIGSLPIHEDQHPILPARSAPSELMSFVGSRSSAVRTRLLDLFSVEHDAIVDTDSYNAWSTTPEERARQRRVFERSLASAAFSLCPRGLGTSSLRLYESMQAGRCPVIIADDWVEDYGVDWSFAVRVAESDVERLPSILSAIPRSEAIERGQAGRAQWEASYSPQRYVHTLAHAALAMVERKATIPDRTLLDVAQDGLHNCFVGARSTKQLLQQPIAVPAFLRNRVRPS